MGVVQRLEFLYTRKRRFSALSLLHNRRRTNAKYDPHQFERVIDALQEFMDGLGSRLQDRYRHEQHQAILGSRAAKSFFEDKINLFLTQNPQFNSVACPPHYSGLTEALFQETLGHGPMSLWFGIDSRSAKLNGVNIEWEQDGQMVPQPFQFRNIGQVERFVTALTMLDPQNAISATNPVLETNMANNVRVAVWMPPRARQPYLAFRQYPMHHFSFREEARRRSIGTEAIEWFEMLAQWDPRTVISGAQESGKTTFAKVMYAAQDPHQEIITVERKHYEMNLSLDFPERAVHIVEIRASIDDMKRPEFFDELLRANSKIMLPEARSYEIELYLQIAENGNPVIATCHSLEPWNIPAEWARKLARTNANAEPWSERERVAFFIDVVVTMGNADEGRKVVQSVYHYDYDADEGVLYVIPWSQFDPVENHWTYNHTIPDRLRGRMAMIPKKSIREGFARFDETLQTLAERFPMKDTKPIVHQIRGRF